jgi:multidrug resistance efflux pump
MFSNLLEDVDFGAVFDRVCQVGKLTGDLMGAARDYNQISIDSEQNNRNAEKHIVDLDRTQALKDGDVAYKNEKVANEAEIKQRTARFKKLTEENDKLKEQISSTKSDEEVKRLQALLSINIAELNAISPAYKN